MTPSMVGLIFSIIGALFLIVGILWGLIRGLKKSLFRGLWIFGVALLTYFLTPVISNALCNIDISAFASITIEGEEVTTVFETIRNILLKQEQIVEIINENPSLLPLLQQVVVLIINVFVFPILFWATKIVTYPIWAIISAIVFKKKQKTVINGKHMLVKAKKHRLAGMALGLVAGIMVMVVTLMPVIGTINLIKKVDAVEYSASETGEGIISSNVDPEIMEFVDAYSDSILGTALKYSGIEYLSNSMYEFLSTKKIDDQKVTLSRELELYVNLYNDLYNIQKTDFENLTQDSMSIFLNSSENIVKRLFSSSLLKIAGKELIPYAVGFLEKNETFQEQVDSINIAVMKQLALDSLDKFRTTNVNELQQDVLNVIYMAKSLNDGNILVPTIKGELETKEYVNLFTDTVVDQVTKYMFKMPSLEKIYPMALDSAFIYLADVLEFDYTSKEYTGESLGQEDFANVLKGGLTVARSLDPDSEFYITKASFKSTGKFLDTLKDLDVLKDGVFENILSKVVDKAKEEINKSEQADNVKSLIGTIIDKFETLIVNRQVLLETELEEYGILFDDIKVTIEEFSTIDKKQLVLAKYGELLDKLNETEILKEIMPDILNTGWDSIKDGFLDALKDFANLEPIARSIMDNIILVLRNQHVTNPEITSDSNIQLSMEVEFAGIQNLYQFIVDNMMNYFEEGGAGADGLQDDLFGETSTLATDLGEQFDAIRDNLIVTPTVVRNLMAEVFTTVKDGLASNERAQKFIDDIVENMRTFTTGVTWKDELEHIKTLANYARTDGFDINTVGDVLDEVCESKFIGFTLINDMLQEEVQAKYDEMSIDVKNETSDTIIENIKLNVSTISSKIYTAEIDYMLDMIDMIDDINATGGLSYTDIGTKLDGFHDSFTISNVRPYMISYAIENKLKDETEGSVIYSVLTQIGENALAPIDRINATFYTRQFTGIETIANLTYPESKDDLTMASMTEIGTAFFNISNIYDYAMIYNLGEIVINELLDQIDYDDLLSIIDSLKSNITDATTGIMVTNRKPSDTSKVEAVKVKYVACFTDLYMLCDIYETVDGITINDSVNGAEVGGYLDTVDALSIIKEEDKDIALIIVDKFEQYGLDTIRAKKNSKLDEVDEVMPDGDASEIADFKNRIENAAMAYSTNFQEVVAATRTEINTRTTKTYSEIFATLATNMRSLFTNVDIAFETILPSNK